MNIACDKCCHGSKQKISRSPEKGVKGGSLKAEMSGPVLKDCTEFTLPERCGQMRTCKGRTSVHAWGGGFSGARQRTKEASTSQGPKDKFGR